MKNHLAERLEFAAAFHKKTGRHENSALFAEAAAAIRGLEAGRDDAENRLVVQIAKRKDAEAEAYKTNMLLSAMKKYLEGKPSNPPVTGVEKKDLADKGEG